MTYRSRRMHKTLQVLLLLLPLSTVGTVGMVGMGPCLGLAAAAEGRAGQQDSRPQHLSTLAGSEVVEW